MSVWPSGCVCQLLRAPGSKVTYAPLERDGDGALKSWSMRTVPVKYSAGPLADGCDPFFLSSICAPCDVDRIGLARAHDKTAESASAYEFDSSIKRTNDHVSPKVL